MAQGIRTDQPPLDYMLKETGILLFERKVIPRELYQLKFKDNAPPEVLFGIPKTETALIELLETGAFAWSPIHLVKESDC